MPDSSWDAAAWDARYAAASSVDSAAAASVWGSAPNRWIEQETADLPSGRALDLACGEGRNAVWLAARGWQVLAVDFSAVALARGRATQPPGPDIEWVVADATTFVPGEPVDLALLCYLQLSAVERTAAVRVAAQALRPGGVLIVVAHDSRNLTAGVGGPRDPAVLYTAADVVADLDGTGLVVERAEQVLRPVGNAERPAIDALVRARRPS